MHIALPENLKEWCFYDVNTFSYQLKEGAPENIKKEFKEYKNKSGIQVYKKDGDIYTSTE